MDNNNRADPLGGVTAALYDYAEAVDEARVDDFVALFTDDAVFFDEAVRGHDDIGRRVTAMLGRFAATSHHMSNIRVLSSNGDEAEATAYVYAWHQLTDGVVAEIWGRYHSKMRYDDGRWRFAHHTFFAAGSRPDGVLGPITPIPRALLD
jgi:ketosteroid isomerase-like protein